MRANSNGGRTRLAVQGGGPWAAGAKSFCAAAAKSFCDTFPESQVPLFTTTITSSTNKPNDSLSVVLKEGGD